MRPETVTHWTTRNVGNPPWTVNRLAVPLESLNWFDCFNAAVTAVEKFAELLNVTVTVLVCPGAMFRLSRATMSFVPFEDGARRARAQLPPPPETD